MRDRIGATLRLDPERLGAKESPRYRGRGQFAPATARIAEGKARA